VRVLWFEGSHGDCFALEEGLYRLQSTGLLLIGRQTDSSMRGNREFHRSHRDYFCLKEGLSRWQSTELLLTGRQTDSNARGSREFRQV
jgi:hypothetical protein